MEYRNGNEVRTGDYFGPLAKEKNNSWLKAGGLIAIGSWVLYDISQPNSIIGAVFKTIAAALQTPDVIR